jgi:hypothetical protein
MLILQAAVVAQSNVVTGDSDADRVAQMLKVVDAVVVDMDQGKLTVMQQMDVKRFLMRVSWHEGAKLKHRKQLGGGPGRSFFQFEPGKAKDGVDYADSKGWLGKLATAGSTTEADLKTSAAALTLGSPWPAGGLIEKLLGVAGSESDLFAVYVARVALKRLPSAIPEGLDAQTTYWADNWKVQFDSPADRTAKMAQFKTNALELEKLFPKQ